MLKIKIFNRLKALLYCIFIFHQFFRGSWRSFDFEIPKFTSNFFSERKIEEFKNVEKEKL